jgi:hypothetical protein
MVVNIKVTWKPVSMLSIFHDAHVYTSAAVSDDLYIPA